jgi:hypothetical protein
MTEVDDLRQRRQALATRLSAMRERAFRAKRDAVSRQRVGVTRHDMEEMPEFATDEVYGDSATDLQRQIELIDDELARDHDGGLTGKGRRVMRWLRK